MLGDRVRSLSDGLVLGSREAVERAFQEEREGFWIASVTRRFGNEPG